MAEYFKKGDPISMKKLLSLLLVLAMFAGLAIPSAMAEDVVTIDFWYSFENQMVEDIMTVIADFEAANPGIKVNASYAGSYAESNQKLLAAHAANAVPAVQQTIQTSISTFAENGVIEPIDRFIEANGDDMSVYAEGMYQAFNYNGQQYGVPAFCSVCPTMYYNKTFATDEGIEIPKTWDEFDAFLRKATIKDENGNTVRYGCSFAGWGAAYFGPIFWQNGVDAFEDEDMTVTGLGSDKAIEVVKMIKGWVDEGLVKWCYGTNASTNMRQSLIDGTSFAVFHTCAVYSVYQPGLANNGYEVGVAFPPSGEKTIADLGGSGLTIMAKATEEQKQAAYKFIRWLTQPEANLVVIKATGYMPVTTTCLESEGCKEWVASNPELQNLYDHLNDVYAAPSSPVWSDITSKWADGLAQIFIEGVDVETGVANYVEAINEILADM